MIVINQIMEEQMIIINNKKAILVEDRSDRQIIADQGIMKIINQIDIAERTEIIKKIREETIIIDQKKITPVMIILYQVDRKKISIGAKRKKWMKRLTIDYEI